MSITSRPSRVACLFLILALAVGISLPATAAVEDQPAAAKAAADWIAAELDAAEPSFDLFGVAPARADVVLALASLGTRPGSARRALIELRETAAAYIGEPATAGPLAKVLLAVLASGNDPDGFLPARDLEEELRALAATDGSFSEDLYTHSLAVIALSRTSSGAPAGAVDWLVSQQNDDGSWSNPFSPDEGDVDYTAAAVQALVAAGEDTGLEAGVGFLTETQNPDGSWPNPFDQPNANTAGLAGQALRTVGEVEAADLAADFVMSLQTEDGGIKFVAEDPEPNGFATLQGVLALGGPALHVLEVAPFDDVDWDHLFAREIDWLGDSDVARGCDPPANDAFCPDDPVTRGQMAAFLHRGLKGSLEPGEPVTFTDTADSVFVDDIAWLAATDITRGCNPPDNDAFCPDDPVTRGEMAAFLHRALAGRG